MGTARAVSCEQARARPLCVRDSGSASGVEGTAGLDAIVAS